MPNERFRADAALAPLKVFQRRTVDYVFDRLYGEDDPVRQFLVADEVGLGNPSIGPIRSFTPRWSCSIRLFKYFDDRSFVSAGSSPSAFISRTARCDAA